jgi:hypothetical protein
MCPLSQAGAHGQLYAAAKRTAPADEAVFHTLRVRYSSRAASLGDRSTHAPGGAACIMLHTIQCCRCLLQ